jgi:hypothetical protein
MWKEFRPMTVLSKVAALLEAASPAELHRMTPVERARFADAMRHWWQAALREQHRLNPNAGVLGELQAGRRPE